MVVKSESWVGIEEVAEHLKVHIDTIRSWIRKGEMPAHKVGKLWRFKISEIDEWIKSGKSADIL